VEESHLVIVIWLAPFSDEPSEAHPRLRSYVGYPVLWLPSRR
jgi:hypothetical protein